jgi:signal transduction protein with GAF and PtsI domain
MHDAALHEHAERRLRRLIAVRTIDMSIAGSLDLRLTLGVLLDQALSLLGTRAAAVLIYNSRTQTLEYMAGRGFSSAVVLQSRSHLGEGPAGRVALERRPIGITNLHEATHASVYVSLAKAEHLVVYYGVPLIAKGQIKGVLELFHDTLIDPDPEWVDFLDIVAGQAAIAIDNAELIAQLQCRAAELPRTPGTATEDQSPDHGLSDIAAGSA